MTMIAEMVDSMWRRDGHGDVERNRTHAGGYAPSARVMVQRERHDQRERALRLVSESVGRDAYVDPSGERGFVLSFRDNRIEMGYRERCAVTIALLTEHEIFAIGIVSNDGVCLGVRVMYDRAIERAVETATPFYVARLREATQTSNQETSR